MISSCVRQSHPEEVVAEVAEYLLTWLYPFKQVSSVSSTLPDEEDGEVVEGGIGAGSAAVKASVSSAMALSLQC